MARIILVAPKGYVLSNTHGFVAVGAIWMAGLGAAGQFAKVSVIFDQLGAVYPQAGAQLGFALSILGVAGILLGVVAGVLAARLGLRHTLVGGLCLGAVVSLVQAQGLSFDLFLVSRIVEGVAHLAIVVAAPTLIARVSPPSYRAVSLTLWGTFFGVAFAVFAWGGRPLVEAYGVTALYMAHGAWMAGCAVLILALKLPGGAVAGAARSLSPNAILMRHWDVYRSPFLNAAAVGWLFYTICFVSLLTLLPPHIAPEWRGFTMGAMPLMSMLSSMTLGVWLLQVWTTVRMIQMGFVLAGLCAVALIFVPGSPALCLAFSAALGLIQGASFALVPQLNQAENDRADANGVFAQAGNLGNTIGTPVLLAVATVGGYVAMMIVVAVLLLLGAGAHQILAQARQKTLVF